MKNALRILVIIALLFAFLFLIPSAAIVGYAEIITISMNAEQVVQKDEKAIPYPQESGYLSETEYEDPSISVSITTGRMFETTYTVAHIKIANASQIRSAIAGTYYYPQETFGVNIAKRMHAVFAINGDFFSKRPNSGVTIRQGVTYRMPRSDNYLAYGSVAQYDVLLIDDQGDLHIIQRCTVKDLEAFTGEIVNAFTFGPGLVVNGEKQGDFPNTNISPNKPTQRMAIAQVGPLEYLCICCEGPEDRGSVGMTLDEFAELVYSQGNVINAYNLDGGSSSTMAFHGQKINCPNNPKKRPVIDILYFASAYVPDPVSDTQ